jgi:hypothetical protein
MATTAIGVGAAAAGCATSADSRLMDAGRADCPGQIVCPITGELVCIDRCPLGAGGVTRPDVALAVTQPGSCCSTKQ